MDGSILGVGREGLEVPQSAMTGISMVSTPTKLSSEQEDLLRTLARLRDEEQPTGRLANPAEGSLFGKLRDAFKAR